MLGIIGAMDIEVAGIKKIMENTKCEKISGIEFVSGKISNKDVVVAKCGPGKVNAALCAQAMILKYNPSEVINTGVGGGLSEELSIADIAVATDVVQHDCDTSPLGDPLGYISEIGLVEIPCSKKIANSLLTIASSIANTKTLAGTIATGDQFIGNAEKKKYIKETFNAISCEMEGGAIGHVCYANGVDFGVLRAISDNADGNSDMDYPQFAKTAAEKSIYIIKKYIENIN